MVAYAYARAPHLRRLPGAANAHTPRTRLPCATPRERASVLPNCSVWPAGLVGSRRPGRLYVVTPMGHSTAATHCRERRRGVGQSIDTHGSGSARIVPVATRTARRTPGCAESTGCTVATGGRPACTATRRLGSGRSESDRVFARRWRAGLSRATLHGRPSGLRTSGARRANGQREDPDRGHRLSR